MDFKIELGPDNTYLCVTTACICGYRDSAARDCVDGLLVQLHRTIDEHPGLQELKIVVCARQAEILVDRPEFRRLQSRGIGILSTEDKGDNDGLGANDLASFACIPTAEYRHKYKYLSNTGQLAFVKDPVSVIATRIGIAGPVPPHSLRRLLMKCVELRELEVDFSGHLLPRESIIALIPILERYLPVGVGKLSVVTPRNTGLIINFMTTILGMKQYIDCIKAPLGVLMPYMECSSTPFTPRLLRIADCETITPAQLLFAEQLGQIHALQPVQVMFELHASISGSRDGANEYVPPPGFTALPSFARGKCLPIEVQMIISDMVQWGTVLETLRGVERRKALLIASYLSGVKSQVQRLGNVFIHEESECTLLVIHCGRQSLALEENLDPVFASSPPLNNVFVSDPRFQHKIILDDACEAVIEALDVMLICENVRCRKQETSKRAGWKRCRGCAAYYCPSCVKVEGDQHETHEIII